MSSIDTIAPSKLVTLSDASARLAVPSLRVIANRGEQPFPEPVGQIGNARVWDYDAVLAWYRGYISSYSGVGRPRGTEQSRRAAGLK